MVKPGMLITLLLIFNCYTDCVSYRASKNNTPTSDVTSQEVLKKDEEDKAPVEDSIGLIVLSEKNYGKNDFVRIYNEDGSLWYKFTFFYDDSDGEFEYANKDFSPLAFHPDYFVLALKCVGKEEGRYEVIVNEETRTRKYVRADDSTLTFRTWEEHILKVFAIGLNLKENPLREAPQGKVKSISLPDPVVFHPVNVRGDWLEVRWATTDQDTNKEMKYGSGWVQWKKNGKILIELFYIS